MKNKRKGFTLVELVIVIAVIAILAAVLIPTFSQVIDDAKFSSDTADAKIMSTEVAVYMGKNGIEQITAADVLTICGRDELISRRPEKWGFFYNIEESLVEVKRYADEGDFSGFEVSASLFQPGVAYAAENFSGTQLEELMPGYLLLDTAGNIIANTFSYLRNELAHSATPMADYIAKVTQLDGVVSDGLMDNLEDNFNPAHAVYVTKSGVCDNAMAGAKNVVFERGIEVLAANMVFASPLTESAKIYIPASVKYIEKTALNGVTTYNELIFANYQTVVEAGALSEQLKSANAGVAEVAFDLTAGNGAVRVYAGGNELVAEINKAEMANFTYSLDGGAMPTFNLDLSGLAERDSMSVTQYPVGDGTFIEYRIYSASGKIAHVRIQVVP